MLKTMQKTALIIILTLNANTTKAVTCDDVLSLCDKALNDTIVLSNKQANVIKYQDDQIRLQKTKIDELENKNKSLLRSPVLWGVVGFLGGVLLVK
jgi:hypothetical protein